MNRQPTDLALVDGSQDDGDLLPISVEHGDVGAVEDLLFVAVERLRGEGQLLLDGEAGEGAGPHALRQREVGRRQRVPLDSSGILAGNADCHRIDVGMATLRGSHGEQAGRAHRDRSRVGSRSSPDSDRHRCGVGGLCVIGPCHFKKIHASAQGCGDQTCRQRGSKAANRANLSHARDTVAASAALQPDTGSAQSLAAPGVGVMVAKSAPLSSLSKPSGHLPIDAGAPLSSSGAGWPSPVSGTGSS